MSAMDRMKADAELSMSLIEQDIATTAQQMECVAEQLWSDQGNWKLIDQLIALGDRVKEYKAKYKVHSEVWDMITALQVQKGA